MTTITINDKECILKYSLRMYFLFENITGNPFSFGKMVDEYLLFYSCLLANNDDFSMQFDEFINLCDADPKLFNEFKQFMLAEIKQQAQANASEPERVKKKTKRTNP